MKFSSCNPSQALSPFIKKYWEISSLEKISHTEKVIPNGLASLSFHLADLPSNSKKIPYAISNISGIQSQFFEVKVDGIIKLFNVSLTPLGINFLLNAKSEELYNTMIPFNQINSDIGELEEKLYFSKNFQERVRFCNIYFTKKLNCNFSQYELLKNQNIIRLFNFNLSIKKIAEESYISERQFNRNFKKVIGLPPKKFQSIIRFQNSLFHKQINPEYSLTKLTYESNYFDQSHMIRDFKTLTGLSPKMYFKICNPISDFYSI